MDSGTSAFSLASKLLLASEHSTAGWCGGVVDWRRTHITLLSDDPDSSPGSDEVPEKVDG